MFSIAEWAASIQNPLLHTIAAIIDKEAIFAVILLALLFIGERRNDKRLKVLVVFGLAFVLGTAVKYLMAHPRPCVGQEYCPKDYSFPSSHATLSFALAIAFLDKKNYWFYAIFALFVSFTRLNLGVHYFVDVTAGLAVAVLCYYIVDLCWRLEIVKKVVKWTGN